MKKDILKDLLAKPGKKHLVSDFDSSFTGDLSKQDAKEQLAKDIEKLSELQSMLYAQDRYSILIIFQAMDAAGKDGTIKHVMSGINPQGCQVYSFKQPSAEELDHDYIWRINRSLPERGRIGIFNRSHYEDVLIAKVHPEIILSNKLPGVETINDIDPDFWKRRYRQINDFERYLTENGTIVLKFFLNVSKAEQKNRFMERLDDASKNWKFSSGLTIWAFYDNNAADCVVSTFGSGCSTVVTQATIENRKGGKRTFLGFFDPSVRPHFEADKLSYTIPMSRFKEMYETMRQSCLFDTHAWGKIKERMNG